MTTSTHLKPPQPPSVDRKIRFYWYQAVGMLIVVLIPILALASVFGDKREKAQASGGDVQLAVEYPARFRYKTIDSIDVTVRNTGSEPKSVTVTFSKEYLSKFSNVESTPTFEEVTEKEYRVPLMDILPGEAKVVSVEIQAEKYGKHKGVLEVKEDEVTLVEVALSTMSFP